VGGPKVQRDGILNEFVDEICRDSKLGALLLDDSEATRRVYSPVSVMAN
jgi:hypothetical protein